MSFSIKEIITELAREVSLRRKLYPRWVQEGRFSQATADRNIALMEAAIASIKATELMQQDLNLFEHDEFFIE